METETRPTNSITRKRVPCRGRDCHADMDWVECVRRDGKIGRVPLNVTAVLITDLLDRDQLRGKFVYIDTARVRAAVPGDQEPFFESHFTTCPNADDFRGSK